MGLGRDLIGQVGQLPRVEQPERRQQLGPALRREEDVVDAGQLCTRCAREVRQSVAERIPTPGWLSVLLLGTATQTVHTTRPEKCWMRTEAPARLSRRPVHSRPLGQQQRACRQRRNPSATVSARTLFSASLPSLSLQSAGGLATMTGPQCRAVAGRAGLRARCPPFLPLSSGWHVLSSPGSQSCPVGLDLR